MHTSSTVMYNPSNVDLLAQVQTMSGKKWMMLSGAATMALSMLVSGCTEPRGELAGCTTDQQCKGVRLCSSQGECVSPLALPDPDVGIGDDISSPDTSSPDTSSPDAGPDDAGDVSTPPGDTGGDTTETCESAPTARLAGSAATRTVEPGTSVTLDASASTASQGQIDGYEWSFIDYPYASALPHLEPKLVHQADGRVSFEAKTVGTYIVELTVVDDGGKESCNAARAEVVVATDKDIFVELVWDTPGDPDQTDDDGADMDLHYRHPDGDWGLGRLDIFWYNPTADWGEQGQRRDDPELIFDDEDGAGPESVEHDRPEDLNYRVGVYYYESHGHGASEATVRVYLDGALAHEVSAESLPGAMAFYEAVTIDADNKTIAVDDVHHSDYPTN
jgi:hypothetical protein